MVLRLFRVFGVALPEREAFPWKAGKQKRDEESLIQ